MSIHHALSKRFNHSSIDGRCCYCLFVSGVQLKAVRPIVDPNLGFVQQLRMFEQLGNKVPDGNARVEFLKWRVAQRKDGQGLAFAH
jgi:hypothetical protein